MSDDPPLSDDDVYELLHNALLSFSHRTVATADGQAILSTAIRQIEVLQRALIILKEGDGTIPEHPPAT